MVFAVRPGATLADLLAIPEGERFHELLGGELVEKATPGPEHGNAQVPVGALLGDDPE